MKSLEISPNKSAEHPPRCEHGIPQLESCKDCLKASQGIHPWGIVNKLKENGSLYNPRDLNKIEYNFQINPKIDTSGQFEGQTFQIHQIRNPEDPRLNNVLQFLSVEFDPAVLNDTESFKRKLIGITEYGKPRPAYRCFYITNPDDEIIGVRVAEQIPLIKDGEPQPGESIFYAIYIVLKKKYRGSTNIPTEVYAASLMDAAEMAYKTGQSVEYMIAECSKDTEKLQNRIGLKRVYLKNKNGALKEIEFYQPPMQFKKDTGKADSETSAEHLMIMKTNGSEMTKEEVYNTTASLFNQYRSNHPREYFDSDQAFQKHEEIFDKILQDLRNQIDSYDDVVLMSQFERGEASKNTPIERFEAADAKKTNEY